MLPALQAKFAVHLKYNNAMAKAVKPIKARLTKKELENKKAMAFLLYMAGEEQKNISEHLQVTPKTVSVWAVEDKWKLKRAASTVTRDELVNKTLQLIGNMLEDAIASGDKNYTSIANALVQMANTIEKLDKKNNIVAEMEACTKVNKYLMAEMRHDKEITPEFVKKVNKYQIQYINTKIGE